MLNGNELMMKKLRSSNEEDSSSKTGSCLKNCFKFLIFFIIPISMGLIAMFYYKGGLEVIESYMHLNNLIDPIVVKTFENFDKDGNNVLSKFEFQNAFYDLELLKFKQRVAAQKSLKKYLAQAIEDGEEILNLQASLLPIQLETMRKFKDESVQFYKDADTLFTFKSLMEWNSPNLKSANFSVQKFRDIFIPKSLQVGTVWELMPIAMGQTVLHLQSYHYLPMEPSTSAEKLFFNLLSMLHPQPFLRTRFPPFGAVAAVRALGEYYIDVSFRLHCEFQLNNEPQLPFWFTPAAFVGNVIIKKDGSHIESFNMHVPNHHKLNVDMEWISKLNEDSSGRRTDMEESAGEVDIGYIEKMEISSTQPSSLPNHFNVSSNLPNDIKWLEEIDPGKMFKTLERQFYPFKEVPYIPFNETFKKAEEEEKLIHLIILWGSLDDQSC